MRPSLRKDSERLILLKQPLAEHYFYQPLAIRRVHLSWNYLFLDDSFAKRVPRCLPVILIPFPDLQEKHACFFEYLSARQAWQINLQVFSNV